ncbi:MAG: DUF4416 family protein [Planctomycetales bacterium]|nr:DUF4416 family protein [Planctomycetales bacterium]
MAHPQPPPPALLLVAIFSRHEAALDWARHRVQTSWGDVRLASPRFDHSETRYYHSQMGDGLQKQFLVVDGFYDAAGLAATKLQSNAWEAELAASGRFVEPRPLNIDPGYLTLTKLVLASAKDRAHRIYLTDGIYAEECLYYLERRWQARPWTYPDYQRADFQAFFVEARELLKRLMK